MSSLIPESEKIPSQVELNHWMDRCHELINENVMAVTCDMVVAEFVILAMKQLPRCIVRIKNLEFFMEMFLKQKGLPEDQRLSYEQLLIEAEMVLRPPEEDTHEIPVPSPLKPE